MRQGSPAIAGFLFECIVAASDYDDRGVQSYLGDHRIRNQAYVLRTFQQSSRLCFVRARRNVQHRGFSKAGEPGHLSDTFENGIDVTSQRYAFDLR